MHQYARSSSVRVNVPGCTSYPRRKAGVGHGVGGGVGGVGGEWPLATADTVEAEAGTVARRGRWWCGPPSPPAGPRTDGSRACEAGVDMGGGEGGEMGGEGGRDGCGDGGGDGGLGGGEGGHKGGCEGALGAGAGGGGGAILAPETPISTAVE